MIAALAALTRASRERAEAVVAFFAPALDWIQRWLPLFYVPSLIMLPLALQNIDGTPPHTLLATHSAGRVAGHALGGVPAASYYTYAGIPAVNCTI